LLVTPLIRALRARFGAVTALVKPAHRDVLAGNPDVASVWADDASFVRSVARVRAARFDAAVVTWATTRAALVPYLARVPIRVGQTRRSYSGLFTHRVARRSDVGDRTTHWTQIMLDLARAIGCDTADATPTFAVSEDARTAAARLLAAHGVAAPYVVLHPTRGIAAARDRWPIEPFAALARDLAATSGARVVVSGDANDRAIAAAIAAGGAAVSLAGETSIASFAALAASARAVIAMDSGPMHLAAAVGAPTVGIFALQSDEPDRWAPLGRATAVVRATYPCPPDHRKETCPNYACIDALDRARVLAALETLVPRAHV
jgi:lipopolysaccharide heptosyltransferase II